MLGQVIALLGGGGSPAAVLASFLFAAAAAAVYYAGIPSASLGALVMTLTIEAIYENGVLKPAQPLPLKEHEKVQLTVLTVAEASAAATGAPRGYGLVHWTGPAQRP
jgi:hypothetical protein